MKGKERGIAIGSGILHLYNIFSVRGKMLSISFASRTSMA